MVQGTRLCRCVSLDVTVEKRPFLGHITHAALEVYKIPTLSVSCTARPTKYGALGSCQAITYNAHTVELLSCYAFRGLSNPSHRYLLWSQTSSEVCPKIHLITSC